MEITSEIFAILSRVLTSLPDETHEAFKLCKPEFALIPANYNAEQFLQRFEKFKKSLPDRIPNISASHHMFLLSKDTPSAIKKVIDLAVEALTAQTGEYSRRFSKDDLLYLVRIWAFFSRRKDGPNEFSRYWSEELENILKFSPLSRTDVFQGVLFHFRADGDLFDLAEGIQIRRLYPWEYSEMVLEILEMREGLFRIPALETLADANFVLEVSSDTLIGDDRWARLHDLRRIVDVISAASKGHTWAPILVIRRNGSSQWLEGVKGADFSGLVGVVTTKQASAFISRVRKGLTIRDNPAFESVCRSLRQEEEDYGFEFRLVKLFHSLEKLLGGPEIDCGMRLAWLLGRDSSQRKSIFEEFKHIRELRNDIVHRVLLYDLMTSEERSDTLNSIRELHDWLFDALADFLDAKLSLGDWQDCLKSKLFGR